MLLWSHLKVKFEKKFLYDIKERLPPQSHNLIFENFVSEENGNKSLKPHTRNKLLDFIYDFFTSYNSKKDGTPIFLSFFLLLSWVKALKAPSSSIITLW